MILAAAAGAIVGAIFGFVASVLTLLLRQRRNEKLIERGQPPIRDAVHPPYTFPSMALGALITMLATRWIPLSLALVLATVIPALLFLISIVVVTRQAR